MKTKIYHHVIRCTTNDGVVVHHRWTDEEFNPSYYEKYYEDKKYKNVTCVNVFVEEKDEES